MWTYGGAPPSPVPLPSPAEDAGVLGLYAGSEGDAAAAAVLKRTTSTTSVADTVNPVMSFYACLRATAAATMPLPIAARILACDSAPLTQ